MTTPSSELPTYRSDLEHEHRNSYDCKKLGVGYYPDLHADIKATISQIREGLYGFLDKDEELTTSVDRILTYGDNELGKENYQSLLACLNNIQRRIGDSRLNEEERIAFWRPFAESYVKVQGALKERITPMEKRQLVKLGETINVQVRVIRDGRTGRLILTAELPKFKYALERTNHSNTSHHYRDEMSFHFTDEYLKALPAEVTQYLEEGTMELPLKAVSESPGFFTISEIDIPAFLAMQRK